MTARRPEVDGAGGASLVHRAAEVLREGPVHTLELARLVLGLRGHPGAASAAVFSLLGEDRRFRVDGRGTWTLEPGVRALGRPLSELGFAVVDVETTGGGARKGHRVTEIAVVEVRGGEVVESWESLVNPGRSIPGMVQSLTGITPAMVREAPFFEHLARTVRGRLEGRVFVAHNVGFDWRFVSTELARAGEDLRSDPPRLCTVKLARALIPRLRRRNLDALTRHFGIPVHARHRAHGDALATARVLIRLLDEAQGMGLGDLEALVRHLEHAGRRRGRRGRRGRFRGGRDGQRDLFGDGGAGSTGSPPDDDRGEVA